MKKIYYNANINYKKEKSNNKKASALGEFDDRLEYWKRFYNCASEIPYLIVEKR